MSTIEISPQVGGFIGQVVVTLIIGFIIAVIGFLSKQYVIGMFGILMIGLFSILYPMYLRKTEYKITENKIIKKRDTLSETHEEVPFNRVQNTQLTRGYIQKRMGGFGNISLSTAGSGSSDLKLIGIKKSERLHNIISEKCDNKTKGSKSNEKTDDKTKVYKESQKLSETSEILKNIINNGDKL